MTAMCLAHVVAAPRVLMRHLLTLFDWSTDTIHDVYARSAALKEAFGRGERLERHPRRVCALLFEKPSLRTRVSFEAAMTHLGGSTLYLGNDVGWGQRESIADFAAVLGNYVDVVVCRAFAHERVELLAQHSAAPVINGLTDSFHPCQALADLFTLHEHFGSLEGVTLAYVGDANNVARSLAICCARLSVRFRLAAPKPYQFDEPFLERLREIFPEWRLEQTEDPYVAVSEAHAVYTDVWASMGQEDEREMRRRAFQPYQVNQSLMEAAPPHAVFMHCLPAHRGEEVTDEVIDGARSIVLVQAENRMHVQKGILDRILGQDKS